MSLVVQDEVDLSVRQFRGAWRVMCGGASDAVIEPADGVEFIFSHIPIPFFNVALLTSRNISADALTSLARKTCDWASGRSVPWLFVLTHEALDPGIDAQTLLDGCGLAPVMPMTGMVTDRVGPPKLPEGLQLTVPADETSLAAILDLNGAAYGMDLNAGQPLFTTRSFWTGHFPVVAAVDGTPAATASVLMVEGIRYVALVATDPARQRHGYADAAMRHALQLSAAVHGDCATVLHSSEAGRRIYERMGYRPISTHTMFMEKRFLAGH